MNLLESQMLRLKTELNNLKNSDIGELVKQNKKAEKYGQGTTSDLSDGTQYMFDLLEEMKNIVIQWTETGKRPMVFNQFVDGSHPLIQKGQEQGMLDVNFDDEDFDGDGFEMSDEEIAEMLGFLSMMEGGGAPKRRRRR